MKEYKIELILEYPYKTVSDKEYNMYSKFIDSLHNRFLYCSYYITVDKKTGIHYTHLRYKVYSNSFKHALDNVLYDLHKYGKGQMDESIDEIMIGEWWHDRYA